MCAKQGPQDEGPDSEAHTSGDILAIAKTLGRDDVWELRGQIYEDYGAGTTEDIEELEKEFDKAEFKGKPMGLCDSMSEYLVWVTKQQSDLVDKALPRNRDQTINTLVQECWPRWPSGQSLLATLLQCKT